MVMLGLRPCGRGNQHPSLPANSSLLARVVFGVLGVGLKWSVGGRWSGFPTGSEREMIKMNCGESLGRGDLKRRQQRNVA